MRTLLIVVFSLFSTTIFAHNTEQIVQNQVFPPVISVPSQPVATYTIPEINRPTIVHRWVPVYVNRAVRIINQNRLFSNHQEIVYESVIEWVYQPYYIY